MEAAELLARLKSERMVLACAESCTGGLLSSWLTDVSGASENFWGSWGVYDNTAKQALGVPAELIRAHGAVSAEVAQSLAEQGLARLTSILSQSTPGDSNLVHPFQSLIVVSTTGIAGPTGGTERKPVGLCYIGIAISGQKTVSHKITAPPGLSRIQNKEHFTRMGIRLLCDASRVI